MNLYIVHFETALVALGRIRRHVTRGNSVSNRRVAGNTRLRFVDAIQPEHARCTQKQ